MKDCTAFVAVVGEGYNSASWLNAELHQAVGLSRSSLNRQPLVFGLSVDGASLPRCSAGLVVNWLGSEPSYLQLLQEGDVG